jgi:hypothetical protein
MHPGAQAINEVARPRKATWPLSGGKIPDRIRSKVVLPHPLLPIKPRISPRFRSNEMSSKAQNSCLRKCDVSCRTPTILHARSLIPYTMLHFNRRQNFLCNPRTRSTTSSGRASWTGESVRRGEGLSMGETLKGKGQRAKGKVQSAKWGRWGGVSSGVLECWSGGVVEWWSGAGGLLFV